MITKTVAEFVEKQKRESEKKRAEKDREFVEEQKRKYQEEKSEEGKEQTKKKKSESEEQKKTKEVKVEPTCWFFPCDTSTFCFLYTKTEKLTQIFSKFKAEKHADEFKGFVMSFFNYPEMDPLEVEEWVTLTYPDTYDCEITEDEMEEISQSIVYYQKNETQVIPIHQFAGIQLDL